MASRKKQPSMIERGMQLVDRGLTPYAAAKEVGLKQPGSLYRAIKMRKTKAEGRCPHCGAPIDAHGAYVPNTGD